MDFLLWAARAMHLFSVVLWIGGMLYQAVTMLPRLSTGQVEEKRVVIDQLKHFLPFVWTGLLTVLVSGIALMLFNPRFMFFSYHDWWSVALGLKQAVFLLMGVISFGYGRMMIRLSETQLHSWPAEASAYCRRMMQFHRTVLVLGIGAVLLAASMQ